MLHFFHLLLIDIGQQNKEKKLAMNIELNLKVITILEKKCNSTKTKKIYTIHTYSMSFVKLEKTLLLIN